MLSSPEKIAICLAADAVSKTPEAFMLDAAVTEARQVLEQRMGECREIGDLQAAQNLEEVLDSLPVTPASPDFFS